MRSYLRLLLFLAASPFAVGLRASSPPSDPAESPTPASARAPAGEQPFWYTDYAAILDAYVDDRGLVAYEALAADRLRLDAYADSLGRVDPNAHANWPPSDRIAFWINAYNAFTLRVIIDHYPIKASIFKSLLYPKNSIRQIDGVWDEIAFTVLGEDRTLDAIEHDILRARFDEPRIHMALVCAAMGCPPLRNEPYQGPRLESQLDDQARRFLADSRRFRIDRRGRRVLLSPIFKWYGADFIGKYGVDRGFRGRDASERAVLAFISGYLDHRDRAYLAAGDYAIEYLDYDWSLNEHPD